MLDSSYTVYKTVPSPSSRIWEHACCLTCLTCRSPLLSPAPIKLLSCGIVPAFFPSRCSPAVPVLVPVPSLHCHRLLPSLLFLETPPVTPRPKELRALSNSLNDRTPLLPPISEFYANVKRMRTLLASASIRSESRESVTLPTYLRSHCISLRPGLPIR
jgi:hypothetical protein